jgi:salicylate hydroxylase
MPQQPRVLIVGAGLGGLTAALALLKKGCDVALFERSPTLSEAGAGLHCSPNGTRVLYALGLEQPLSRLAVNLQGRDVRLWSTGEAWDLQGHGASAAQRYGAPYLLLHRGDLHGILAAAVEAEDGEVRLNARCIGFTQDADGVHLDFDDGSTASGDLLIGADGIHSTIRKQLFGPDKPLFTGDVAWRGLVPVERLPSHLTRAVTSNWIGPKGSVTFYPVRRGELMNFVGLVERGDWQVESWIDPGTTEECLSDFVGWDENIHEIIRNIDVPYKWGLFLREPLPQWTRGHASLLGDACHATTPYLGQGANMAIEDACILARAIEMYSDDWDTALSAYEKARRERTARIVVESTEQSKRIHDPRLADAAAAKDYVDANWAPDKVRLRYDWIYDYDAIQVAV